MFFKKPEKAPALRDAIVKLQQTEDLLVKKQEHLESKIDHELKIAKENVNRNKPAALAALKRKKRYENQLQKIDGTLTTIELQRETLEEAGINSAVLNSMKNAAHALNLAHCNVDVEKVHGLLDSIADQHDLANEITDAISTPVGMQDIDEDELEKELEALEDEDLEASLCRVPEQYQLPTIPAEEIPTATKSAIKVEHEEDKEIKELEKWAL